MRIRAPISDEIFQGFNSETDIFEFKSFGEKLGLLVRQIDKPVTVILDGPWGSGKSTFTRQWQHHLEQQHASVVYFNAFEHDFHENAFVSMARQIDMQIAKTKGVEASTRQTFLEKASAVGKAMLPLATKIGVKAITLGALSAADYDEFSDASKKFTSETSDILEAGIGKVIAQRLQQAEEDEEAMDLFRKSLECAAKELAEVRNTDGGSEGLPWPLIFIIDELDRCKPSFALEILETIKHLFTVPNLAFLLVTNLPHLAAAVEGRYGNRVDGLLYLQKFYDVRFSLPLFSENNTVTTRRRFLTHLWHKLELGNLNQESDQGLHNALALLADARSFQLRDIERLCMHLAIFKASSRPNSFQPTMIVATLICMRHDAPSLFMAAANGTLRYEEAKSYLDWSTWKDQEMSNHFMKWITFCCMETLEAREKWVTDFYRLTSGYHLDRTDVMPFIAQQIEAIKPS